MLAKGNKCFGRSRLRGAWIGEGFRARVGAYEESSEFVEVPLGDFEPCKRNLLAPSLRDSVVPLRDRRPRAGLANVAPTARLMTAFLGGLSKDATFPTHAANDEDAAWVGKPRELRRGWAHWSRANPGLRIETWATRIHVGSKVTPNGCGYCSRVMPARRFCCQHSSVDSEQKGFSLP
jgi:hypothetical protein